LSHTTPAGSLNPDHRNCLNLVTGGTLWSLVQVGVIGTGVHTSSLLSSYDPSMAAGEQNDLIWKTDRSSIEIRLQGQLEDGRPALDEVVANGAGVHLEQMDHDHYWMGIQSGGRGLPALVYRRKWALVRANSPIRKTKAHTGKGRIVRGQCRERMLSGLVGTFG
jgi:hypothetical protein